MPGGRQQKRNKRRGGAWTKARVQALGCILVSLLLYGALSFMPDTESPVTPDGAIGRDGYGGDVQQYPLYVDGILEEPVPLTVEVDAKRFTEAEAKRVFAQLMDGMEDRIRGENPSLSEVRKSLTLPTWLSEYGVRLRWSASNPEILDSFGQVQNEDLDTPDGIGVSLSLQMTADTYRQEHELPIRVLPPDRTEQQSLVEGLLKEIRTRNTEQVTGDTLLLPEEYAGKKLHYREQQEDGYEALLLLGVIMAALCYAKEQADEKEQKKRRERELLLDYAELLSKLMVFLGAGMTVRGAWERIVTGYEAAVQTGRQKRRAAYEEMGQTWHQLKSGMPEGAAYREFGNRCRLQPYLKLSSLLEQNRRTGTKNLREILQIEMADAFEQRKNLARRLGEEAGTKLLLPLFLMLGIVMAMIMVPAMMTMG